MRTTVLYLLTYLLTYYYYYYYTHVPIRPYVNCLVPTVPDFAEYIFCEPSLSPTLTLVAHIRRSVVPQDGRSWGRWYHAALRLGASSSLPSVRRHTDAPAQSCYLHCCTVVRVCCCTVVLLLLRAWGVCAACQASGQGVARVAGVERRVAGVGDMYIWPSFLVRVTLAEQPMSPC